MWGVPCAFRARAQVNITRQIRAQPCRPPHWIKGPGGNTNLEEVNKSLRLALKWFEIKLTKDAENEALFICCCLSVEAEPANNTILLGSPASTIPNWVGQLNTSAPPIRHSTATTRSRLCKTLETAARVRQLFADEGIPLVHAKIYRSLKALDHNSQTTIKQ